MSRGDSGVRVRPLASHADLARCVALQRRIWGADFAEVVSASILWVATRTGGIVAAAVDEHDDMLGFVFGITGWRDGRPLHWSDMLGVREDARGRGIGQLLKRHQRAALLDAGVGRVCWTFEPLESRNAWLNFAKLGITAREYIVDCYGPSASPLHAGLGTDRLVADWQLDSDRVRGRMDGDEEPPGPPPDVQRINAESRRPDLKLDAPHLLLRIPADIQTLKRVDPAAAARWRQWTRPVFEAYLGRGYEVRELYREGPRWSSYLFART